MYFELDPQQWYYYRYKLDNLPRMQTYSPNEDYMTKLNEIKEKDREMNTKKGEATYKYEIATRTSKDAFLDRFK